jgi:NADH-quinone oxidoreductase subunit D
LPALQRFIDTLPGFIDEYDRLLEKNEILLSRTKSVGILTRESAIKNSVAGPVLRGSGVNWDIRKADPYSVYDRFSFNIPLGSVGDVYDRYRVRILEMQESVSIIQQAMKGLPTGEIQATVSKNLRPETGEAYGHIEGPKGELGFYLVSDNSNKPYRLHVRPPSFINLTALRELLIGVKIADAAVIFGSIDICMGEVDR